MLSCALRYGLGPHENYPDRKAAAWLGVHSLPLEGMHTPYVVPSENGGRGGVRWLALHGEEEGGARAGGGLLLAAGPLTPPLQASVSAYSAAALTAATHERELLPDGPDDGGLGGAEAEAAAASSRGPSAALVPRPPPRAYLRPERAREWADPSVYVHLDALHMGVGGHDSWTALKTVGEAYYVAPHQRAFFRLRLSPLSAGRGPTADPEASASTGGVRPALFGGMKVMLRALSDAEAAAVVRAGADSSHAQQNALAAAFASPASESESFAFNFGGADDASSAADTTGTTPGSLPPSPDLSDVAAESPDVPGTDAPHDAADGLANSLQWTTFEGAQHGASPPPSSPEGGPPEGVATPPATRRGAPAAPAAAAERDVFLRIANQAGIAPLPLHFTSVHRHYGAVTVEKKAGGPLSAGNTISLRGGNGYCLDVEGQFVQASARRSGRRQRHCPAATAQPPLPSRLCPAAASAAARCPLPAARCSLPAPCTTDLNP